MYRGEHLFVCLCVGGCLLVCNPAKTIDSWIFPPVLSRKSKFCRSMIFLKRVRVYVFLWFQCLGGGGEEGQFDLFHNLYVDPLKGPLPL